MAENSRIMNAWKDDKLDSCKLGELKEYLRSVGQHVSGNKSDLIERVKGACRLRMGNVYEARESERQDTMRRERERLKTPLGETLIHPTYIDNWTDDLSKIPDLTEKDIYNYFVFKLNTKRQLKSKVMYEDRHVYNVQVNETDENQSHCYVKCRVLPSLPTINKKQSPDYNVWVMLSKMTGCINSAECTCTAGEGEGCNHVAALLYAISDISEKKKDGKLAPTSQKCKWNNPRKRKLTPKKSQDLTFKKFAHGKESARKALLVPIYNVKEPVDIVKFKDKLLAINSNAGWLKNFEEKTNDLILPKLHDINFNYNDKVDLCDDKYQHVFRTYFQDRQTSASDCVAIECLTRNQNESDLWSLAREERLTASYFGRVCKIKTSTKPDTILKDILNYRSFNSVHTKYGRTHENAARMKYRKIMAKSHPGITVTKCGLLVTPEYPHLGASPDGFVNCTHCEIHNGLLEIKCPSSFNWRMKSPEECSADPKFFCALIDGKVKLKRSHNYFYQVQGQLGISGRKWCDFVVWTCVGISVERIFADNDFFRNHMLPILNDFYLKAFIPEMFTSRVKRGIPLYDQ